jgi:hypothetical protein
LIESIKYDVASNIVHLKFKENIVDQISRKYLEKKEIDTFFLNFEKERIPLQDDYINFKTWKTTTQPSSIVTAKYIKLLERIEH